MTVAAAGPARLRGMIAAIAAITVVAVASTMTMLLLTLLMERMARSSWEIGFNTALASLGIILAGPIGGRALARFGAPGAMLGALGVMAAMLSGFALTDHFGVWCVLRLGLGCAVGVLFLGSEYWVVAVAPPRRRGRIIALYAATLAGGYAAGPIILKLTGVDGFAPFAATIALAALAAVPIVLFAGDAPPARSADDAEAVGSARSAAARAASPWGYFRTDTTLVAAVILFGAIEFGAMGLAPVWALAEGYTEAHGITFAIVLAAGGFLFLPVIGWIADLVPARPILLAAAAISLVVGALLPIIAAWEAAVWAALFIWGGTAAALYTVSLTEMGARHEGAALAGGNAAIVMGYGIGATAGPLLIGIAMETFGADGLPLVLIAACAVFLTLAVARGLIRQGDRR